MVKAEFSAIEMQPQKRHRKQPDRLSQENNAASNTAIDLTGDDGRTSDTEYIDDGDAKKTIRSGRSRIPRLGTLENLNNTELQRKVEKCYDLLMKESSKFRDIFHKRGEKNNEVGAAKKMSRELESRCSNLEKQVSQLEDDLLTQRQDCKEISPTTQNRCKRSPKIAATAQDRNSSYCAG